MRRIPAVALATLMTLIALALGGCSQWFENPAKPANDAIVAANAHLRKAAASEPEVAAAAAALEGVAYTRTGALQALKTTASVKAALAAQRTELEAGKAAMDGIAKLKVAGTFKQYAKLEATAIDTRITIVDSQTRLYDALDTMYAAVVKRGAKSDPQEILTAIAQIRREIAQLTDQAVAQTKAAAGYFTANKLGG